ncbi:MAG: MFS transporter [Ilumatobacteraceae bacterium]
MQEPDNCPTLNSDTRSDRRELATLTASKSISNLALRWITAFLPTLERAFSTTTGTLTSILGLAELGGLSTTLVGRTLDRGRHRLIFVASLLLITASSVIALGGSIATFSIAMVLLLVGVSNLTVAGIAYIGERVSYSSRGRAIGTFETSWALSLLLGAPILAFLIDRYGWRAAYVALALLNGLAAVAIFRSMPAPQIAGTTAKTSLFGGLPRSAWPPLIASAAVAGAGMSIFVVMGAWLSDDYGLSVAGLGAIATGIGAAELASSSAVAVAADRIGIRRSVGIGGLLLGLGLVVIALSNDSVIIALIGLIVLVIGFEYGFVSSLSLMSEAAPQARGTAIAVGNAIATITRASLIVISGQCYERFGILGSATVSAAALCAAAAALVADRRRPVGQ